MLALSPSMFQTYGWPLEDPIAHEQVYFSTKAEKAIITAANVNFFQSQPPEILELDHSASFTDNNGDPNTVKKLNHNASESDRRKKMNSPYSSLRFLLPAADQTKKLSIPATVSRVLKFIPELQQEVKKLVQMKEELLSKISKQGQHQQVKQRKGISTRSSLSAVSATHLSDTEVLIQISTFSIRTTPLSEILLHLLEDGYVLINSSSFQSFGGRVFYNLHLQVDRSYKLDCETLREKLVSLYEKGEGFSNGIHNI
ncbi:transcription factor ORG2-like [Hevea brasiliensis]|nr:transcription factor ORG2-like [Hevea brasiliensis]